MVVDLEGLQEPSKEKRAFVTRIEFDVTKGKIESVEATRERKEKAILGLILLGEKNKELEVELSCRIRF